MNIDFERMRVFFTVAQEGGITKASHKLHLDKSSVSRHIQILEQELGKTLLVRSREGLILTPEGRYTFEKAQEILDQMRSLQSYFDEPTDGKIKGSLRINSTHALTATWLTLIMARFINDHPELHFEIIASNEPQNMTAGEFDIAIRPCIDNAPHLIQEPLMRWRLQLYASKEYLKRFGIPKRPEDLDQHRLILFGDPSMNFPRSYISWPLHVGTQRGQIRKPFITLNSVPGMYHLVQSGLGIGSFAKESPIFKRYDLVPVLPNLPGTEVEVCYIYPASHQFLRKIQVFRDYIKQEILAQER